MPLAQLEGRTLGEEAVLAGHLRRAQEGVRPSRLFEEALGVLSTPVEALPALEAGDLLAGHLQRAHAGVRAARDVVGAVDEFLADAHRGLPATVSAGGGGTVQPKVKGKKTRMRFAEEVEVVGVADGSYDRAPEMPVEEAVRLAEEARAAREAARWHDSEESGESGEEEDRVMAVGQEGSLDGWIPR